MSERKEKESLRQRKRERKSGRKREREGVSQGEREKEEIERMKLADIGVVGEHWIEKVA